MALLPRIERYLRQSGTAPTRFGRDAVNDPRFVFNLRRGRMPRESMLSRVEAHLAEQEARIGRVS
jgi:hypothetical protein